MTVEEARKLLEQGFEYLPERRFDIVQETQVVYGKTVL
jgi:hypothetical protein